MPPFERCPLMGAGLVALVLTHWTHVSDPAFRVLVRMSLTALDKPQNGHEPKIYRGGRELLAMSLRSDKGSEQTRFRAVRKALAELSEAGAIQHLQLGWAGQRSVYRLTLDRVEKEGSTAPPVGGPTHPPKEGADVSKRRGLQTPPRSYEESLGELDQEESRDLETASHPPRASREAPKNAKVISLYPRRERPENIRAEDPLDVAERAHKGRAAADAAIAASRDSKEAK